MFCHKCGSEIEPGSKFCPICGTPVMEENYKSETDYQGMPSHQDFYDQNHNQGYDQGYDQRYGQEEYANPGSDRRRYNENARHERKSQEGSSKDKVILGVLTGLIAVLGVAVVFGGIMLMFFGKKTETVNNPNVEEVRNEENGEAPSQIPQETQKETVTPTPTQAVTATPVPDTGNQQSANAGGVLRNSSDPGAGSVQTPPDTVIRNTPAPQYNYTRGEFIIPDSSARYVTYADLDRLTEWQIRIARNEIYARHGRMFKSEDLQQYFGSTSWYYPTVPAEVFDNSYLNQVEVENLKTITQYEKAHNLNQ